MNTYIEIDRRAAIYNPIAGISNSVKKLVSSLSKSVTFKASIPNTVYLRTQLLCEYISDEVGVEFGVENFLMTLYIDFTNESIKKYDPMKIYRIMSNSYGYDDTIKISFGEEAYVYRKRNENMVCLVLEMDKKDVLKGDLLLKEIAELYSYNISFEKMMSNLWINFIEEYKKGSNNKALNAIIKILKG